MLLGKGLLGRFIVLGIVILQRQQGQNLPDLHGDLVQFLTLLHHALVGGLGPATCNQLAAVHKGPIIPLPMGDGVKPPHQRVTGGQGQLPIQRFCRHDGRHTLHGSDGLQIGLFQAQIACNAQVIQVGFVIQFTHRVPHVGGGSQQTCQKARAQRNDEENRQKAAEAASDRAETFLEKRTLYHSISSTGVGEGLTSLPTI